jgi:hypothetical protein
MLLARSLTSSGDDSVSFDDTFGAALTVARAVGPTFGPTTGLLPNVLSVETLTASARRGTDGVASADAAPLGSDRGAPPREVVEVATIGSAVRIAAEAALNVEGRAATGAALDEASIEDAELTLVLDAVGGPSTLGASSPFASVAARSVSVNGAGDE